MSGDHGNCTIRTLNGTDTAAFALLRFHFIIPVMTQCHCAVGATEKADTALEASFCVPYRMLFPPETCTIGGRWYGAPYACCSKNFSKVFFHHRTVRLYRRSVIPADKVLTLKSNSFDIQTLDPGITVVNFAKHLNLSADHGHQRRPGKGISFFLFFG